MRMEAKEETCAWCREKVMPVSEWVQSDYGKVLVLRCPKCNKLIATRLEGIRLDIIDEGEKGGKRGREG